MRPGSTVLSTMMTRDSRQEKRGGVGIYIHDTILNIMVGGLGGTEPLGTHGIHGLDGIHSLHDGGSIERGRSHPAASPYYCTVQYGRGPHPRL